MSGRTSTMRPSPPIAYRLANSPAVSGTLQSKSNPVAGPCDIRRVATNPRNWPRISSKALLITGELARCCRLQARPAG